MPFYKDALTKYDKLNGDPEIQYANIVKTGQLGIGHSLRTLDACTPLSLPSIVPIVIHVPNMFKKVSFMPDMLKALIERHSKSITGIDFQYNLEDSTGMEFRDSQSANIPTRVVRAPISPSIVHPEYSGQPVGNFYKTWLEMIANPDTQFSKLSSYLSTEDIDPFIYSWFTMDILFIQFDVTFLPKNIIDGFIVTAMYPKTNGAYGYKKEISSANTVPEKTVEYHGILQHTTNTRLLAIKTAELLKMHQADYTLAENALDDDYTSTIQTDSGLNGEMSNILETFKIFE